MQFTKATKKKARLRMLIAGPSGAGKTYTALRLATAMGGKIAFIDTEHGSASKYADEFSFDVLELTEFSPMKYVEAIRAAEAAGYEIIVVDSLSHEWVGKGGALEMVDKATRASTSKNSYNAWGDVTPKHAAMIEAILASRAHLFATVRSKMDYVQEKNERTGKTEIRKVGLAPVQRDGMEYEFDVIGDLNINHFMTITKTRCSALAGETFEKPGAEVAEILKAWLTDGEDAPAPKLTDGLDSGLRINEEEAAAIREWLDVTASNEDAFLKYYQAGKVEDLTPAKYEDAILMFEKKARKGAAA